AAGTISLAAELSALHHAYPQVCIHFGKPTASGATSVFNSNDHAGDVENIPMDVTVFLSRIQFGLSISLQIIFAAFIIAPPAWLAVLEILRLPTETQVNETMLELWHKIFGIVFCLRVAAGVVIGFQFGTNSTELSWMSGPIPGPLLLYETIA